MLEFVLETLQAAITLAAGAVIGAFVVLRAQAHRRRVERAGDAKQRGLVRAAFEAGVPCRFAEGPLEVDGAWFGGDSCEGPVAGMLGVSCDGEPKQLVPVCRAHFQSGAAFVAAWTRHHRAARDA
jgi:hypothetical protein